MPQVVCVEGPAPGYLLVAGPVLHQGPRPVDGVHSLRMDYLAVVSPLHLFSYFLHWNLHFVFLRAALPAGHASGCVCRGPCSWLFASCWASSPPGPTACWRSSLTVYGSLSCSLPCHPYFLFFYTGTYALCFPVCCHTSWWPCLGLLISVHTCRYSPCSFFSQSLLMRLSTCYSVHVHAWWLQPLTSNTGYYNSHVQCWLLRRYFLHASILYMQASKGKSCLLCMHIWCLLRLLCSLSCISNTTLPPIPWFLNIYDVSEASAHHSQLKFLDVEAYVTVVYLVDW